MTKIALKKIYPYILLTVLFLVLLIRNWYSFCWSDESLYISNMYRLYQGDVFLIDDWHKSTLSSYVTLPLFELYMLINGSTDGVYLYFRNVIVVLAFINSIMIYNCISSHFSNVTALICSVCLLIYSRANICGVSYYNMGLHLFVFTLCIYYLTSFVSTQDTWKVKLAAFGGGICLGLAIIVNPYIIIIFPLFIIAYMKTNRKSILMTGFGCVLCGLIFFAFYLSGVGVSQLSKAFENLSHVEEAAVWSRFFKWFVLLYRFFRPTIWIQCIVFFVQFFMTKLKVRNSYQAQVFLLFTSVVCLVINLISSKNLMGGAYIAFTMFGLQALPAVWVQSSYEEKRSIIYFYLTGVLLSVAFGIASNTGIDAAGIGFVITAFGAVLILSLYRFPVAGMIGNFVKIVKCFVLAGTLGITLFLRIFAVYRDGTLEQLQCKITHGPAKGLYTTQEHLEQYNNVIDDIHTYVTGGAQTNIFITKLAAWAYLCTDARCAVYQTWRTPFFDPMLETYFLDHPQPDNILILNDNYGGFVDNYIVTWGENGDLTPNTNDISGYLLNYVQENGYQCIPVKSGTIYQRKHEEN